MQFRNVAMIDIVIGIVILGAGCMGLWYFKPRNGKLHPHTNIPVLDSVVPVSIVAAFGVAVAMIVAGVAGIMS